MAPRLPKPTAKHLKEQSPSGTASEPWPHRATVQRRARQCQSCHHQAVLWIAPEPLGDRLERPVLAEALLARPLRRHGGVVVPAGGAEASSGNPAFPPVP